MDLAHSLLWRCAPAGGGWSIRRTQSHMAENDFFARRQRRAPHPGAHCRARASRRRRSVFYRHDERPAHRGIPNAAHARIAGARSGTFRNLLRGVSWIDRRWQRNDCATRFSAPASLHEQRLRAAPVGHFFDVIKNGYGVMYSYAARIEPADRWAIIAYIRALQLSPHATPDDVPPDERAKLEAMKKPMNAPLASQFQHAGRRSLVVAGSSPQRSVQLGCSPIARNFSNRGSSRGFSLPGCRSARSSS